MLQSIRDRSQGWLAGAIVSLIIVTFALWGVHSYLTSNGGQPDVVATVNGTKITQTMLNASYERLRQQQQMQLGADFVIDQKVEMQLKKQALNQLIMGQVLTQAAIKQGYRITMGEVEGALLSIPAFQVNGRFSKDRFSDVLRNTLYDEKSFLTDLQTSMLISQVRGGFIASAFALPAEVDTAIKLINQKRDIGYFLISAAHFSKDVTVKEDEALAYYHQHRDTFTTAEQVSINYLQLSLSQLTHHQHFSTEQLQQYYQDNLSNYTTPQRWRIAHILIQAPANATPQQEAAAKAKLTDIEKRLKSGENFAKLAKQFSEDKLSADKGGTLEWFSSGMIDPSIEKAVSVLPQMGDVSEPVRTKYGYTIVKLLDVQKPEVKPLAQVREQVTKALAERQAQQMFADESDKLSSLTYANPNSLDVAAKTLNLQVKSTDLFDKTGGKDEITSNPKILSAAFNPDVLQGVNSEVIELNPDTLVVLRIKQRVPANLKTFEQVRADVIQLLKNQAAQQKAQVLAQTLLQQLKQGASALSLAQKNKVKWQVLNNSGRYNNQAPPAVVNYAFHMPRPEATKVPAVASFPLPNGDSAVIQILAVHDGALTANNASQTRIYREELENTNGQLDYALYVKEQLSKAKIDINNKDLASASNHLS